jgi:hypothetical protein
MVQDYHFIDSQNGEVKGKSHEDSRNVKSRNDLGRLFQKDTWHKDQHGESHFRKYQVRNVDGPRSQNVIFIWVIQSKGMCGA